MTEERKEALANLDDALANDWINSFKAFKVTNDEAYDLFVKTADMLYRYANAALKEPSDEPFKFRKL